VPLSFLGQVSTSQITVPPEHPELPLDTLLAFFYDAAGCRRFAHRLRCSHRRSRR
jgi:hypothetical protein